MNIGEKIHDLRLQNHLTQEELADRAEVSKGFISQIERNLTSPSISTLTDILLGLGTDLKDFFNDFEDTQIVFKEEDYFIKEDDKLKNSIHWVIPNAQKNMMEPILMTLESNGKSLLDNPHEGEEFGYVLEGTIRLHKGKDSYDAKKGESFYFTAKRPHYIENIGSTVAKVIWVSCPPSF